MCACIYVHTPASECVCVEGKKKKKRMHGSVCEGVGVCMRRVCLCVTNF